MHLSKVQINVHRWGKKTNHVDFMKPQRTEALLCQ